MSIISVHLSQDEVDQLKEFRDPKKWGDWQNLNGKCRYVLQRMIVARPGGHEIVMAIAKEASHNLGHCRWCDHEPTLVNVHRVGQTNLEHMAREVFG